MTDLSSVKIVLADKELKLKNNSDEFFKLQKGAIKIDPQTKAARMKELQTQNLALTADINLIKNKYNI